MRLSYVVNDDAAVATAVVVAVGAPPPVPVDKVDYKQHPRVSSQRYRERSISQSITGIQSHFCC